MDFEDIFNDELNNELLSDIIATYPLLLFSPFPCIAGRIRWEYGTTEHAQIPLISKLPLETRCLTFIITFTRNPLNSSSQANMDKLPKQSLQCLQSTNQSLAAKLCISSRSQYQRCPRWERDGIHVHGQQGRHNLSVAEEWRFHTHPTFQEGEISPIHQYSEEIVSHSEEKCFYWVQSIRSWKDETSLPTLDSPFLLFLPKNFQWIRIDYCSLATIWLWVKFIRLSRKFNLSRNAITLLQNDFRFFFKT